MNSEECLYVELGARLRKLRCSSQGSKARLTQAQLAEKVGLERTSITNIERGNQKVPLHILYRICEALGAPISQVLPNSVSGDRVEEKSSQIIGELPSKKLRDKSQLQARGLNGD